MANRRDKHSFKTSSDSTVFDADGDSKRVITRHLKNCVIQVNGTFSADVTVMTRVDTSFAFVELGTLSGPGMIAIPNDAPVEDVKIAVSGYVSGELSAILVGRTSQE